MAKIDKEYVYFRESLLQSVIADFVTYGVMLGSFYINYKFIGNSGWVAVLILVMFLLFITAKASNKKHTFTSKEALIKYLQSNPKDIT